jgi:hypothetical protein
MSTTNRVTEQNRNRKMIAAIQKYLMKLTAIMVAGVTYTPDQIVALLQQEIALADTATQARATFLVAATTVQTERLTMKPILVGFRAFVENMFTDPSVITEFGFPPRKVGQTDPATKVLAAKKARATRTARHTMGKVQKKAVKGTITIDSSTPSTASPPTTSSPVASAPVASAPAQGTTAGTTPHGT